MKIRNVELKNFRQFYGDQKIVFSTDKDRNITLIHAENGTGKTAFLNAILWCLYAIHTDNFKDPNRLINKVAKGEGTYTFSVSIEFETDDGNIYLAQRGLANKQSGVTFKVFEKVNSTCKELDKPSSFINSVIPKDMAKYFFFQGEGVGKTSGSKGGSVVKTAVKEILGFTIAESALADVSNIKKEYQKQFSFADKSGHLAKIQNEIISLESNIDRLDSKIMKTDEAIVYYKGKLEAANKELENSNSATVKQLNSNRQSIEANLKREESRFLDAQENKRKLISEFATTVFGHGFANFALDFIDEAEYKGSVPAPYNEQLVKDILEEARCVCGSDIAVGTDAHMNIVKLLESASDPSLESRVRKARAELTALKSASARAKVRFNSNLKDLADTEQTIARMKGELLEVSHEIKGTESLENIQKIEGERSRLSANLEEEIRSSERHKLNKETDHKVLEQRTLELKRLDASSSELKRLKKLVDFTEGVERVLKETLARASKDVELNVMQKVNKYLQLFVRQDYKAMLDPNTFDIRLVDKDETPIPESDGQALLLSLTFISSLIELSRERKNAKGLILTPGAIAPFIVDAPFGDLDNKYKGHVAEAIPKSVEQVVFLLSSSHWVGTVEQGIRSKVGAEYNMVLEVTSPIGDKGQDQIKILEENYDTVRYSSPVEKTVIEKVAMYV